MQAVNSNWNYFKILFQLSQSDRIIEQLKGEVQQAVKQSQDVTAYEDMIRRLETELVAADEQRKQTIKDFNNLKASMSNSDMAVKEELVMLTSKVCIINRPLSYSEKESQSNYSLPHFVELSNVHNSDRSKKL